jgi:hypothetical protein
MDSVHFNFFNTVILTELNVNNKINFKNKDFCIVIAHLLPTNYCKFLLSSIMNFTII